MGKEGALKRHSAFYHRSQSAYRDGFDASVNDSLDPQTPLFFLKSTFALSAQDLEHKTLHKQLLPEGRKSCFPGDANAGKEEEEGEDGEEEEEQQQKEEFPQRGGQQS
ncbi:hypothetical protein AXG93_3810s1240 [Marchantia polymorpha subsp. ruderalis]|uniref:Uncharacterized protein n=1 Tax=Marchantia polymorpha subsp. ruderalis TaxID=1480154 RepID=A0A176VDP0_MARPO|nr:hypothetical protein AXG93_3810s1240 [Marchantia polymorpha subsp. ruderalis]